MVATAFALALVAGPPSGADQPRERYEQAYAEFLEASAVDATRRQWFDQQCEDAEATALAGAAATAEDPDAAEVDRQARQELKAQGERDSRWVYQTLPDAFPGNAATANPTSDTTTTAERLAAAVQTSVPGEPKVAAGLTVRPFALRGLRAQHDLEESKRLLDEARKKDLAPAKKAHDEAKSTFQKAAAEALRLRTEARLLEAERKLANPPSGPFISRIQVGSFTLEWGEEATPAVAAAPGPTEDEVSRARAAAARAEELRDHAKTEVGHASARHKLAKGKVDGLEKRVDHYDRVMVRKKPVANRFVDSLTVRIGSFEDLGTRIGGGFSLPLSGPKEVVITDAEVSAATDALVAEQCSVPSSDLHTGRVRSFVMERHDAFMAACSALKKTIDGGKWTHDKLKEDDLRGTWQFICLPRPSDPKPRNIIDELGQLGDFAKKVGCKECDPLGGYPPTLRASLDAKQIVDEVLERKGENYLGALSWDTFEARISFDGFADLEPWVYGFAPRDTDGEAARLGEGEARGWGTTTALTMQRRGGSLSYSVGPTGTRDDDFEWKPVQVVMRLQLQCVMASLDRARPLRLSSDAESWAKAPRLTCGRRTKRVNPRVLGDNGKVTAPHLAGFFALEAKFAEPEPHEPGSLQAASVAAGVDFIIGEKLKFRVGVPVQAKLVQQKANDAVAPALVVPKAAEYQWSIPFFLTTVLAL